MGKLIEFTNGQVEESGLQKVNRKAKKHKAERFYRIALIVMVVAAILTAYFVYEKTKVYTEYTITSSIARNISDGASILDFNGNILSYSKDGANSIDSEGKLLWNRTFDMQSPMVAMCGGMVAFSDYGGNVVYVQSEALESATISTDMPIRQIAVAESGYVAAVLSDASVTWIYLYDMNGTVIAYFRTTMEKSGYPVAIDISPNGELVCISYYSLDCNDIKSSVAFFNFGPVGQNNIDNYVSGYNYSDVLIPFVRFIDNETAVAISDERISTYGGEHKPVSISEMHIIDEIQSVYYGAGTVAVIYKNSSLDAKYRMEVYNSKGEISFQKEFDFDYAGVEISKDSVVLYGDNRLCISTLAGDEKYEGNYESPVLLVLPTVALNKYIVVTEDTIDTVEFN